MGTLVLGFLALLAAFLLYNGVQFFGVRHWFRGGLAVLGSAALLATSWYQIYPRMNLDPSELERMKPQLAKLQSAAESGVKEADGLKTKLAEAMKMSEAMTGQKASFDASMAKYKAEAEGMMGERKALQARIDDMTKSRAGADASFAIMRTELVTANTQRMTLMGQLRTASVVKPAEAKPVADTVSVKLQADLDAAMSSHKALQAQYDGLVKAKAGLDGSFGIMKSELVTANTQRLNLMGQIRVASAAKPADDAAMVAMKSEADKVKAERDDLKSWLDKVVTAKLATDSSCNAIKAGADACKRDRDEAKGWLDKVVTAKLAADSACNVVRSQADAAKRDRLSLQGQLDSANVGRQFLLGRVSGLTKAKIASDAAMVPLMADLDAVNGQRVSLQGQVDQLSKAKSAVEGSLTQTRTELVSANTHRLALMGQLRVPAKAPEAPAVSDLMKLRSSLEVPVTTPYYNVSVYPDPELVQGKKGRYYTIGIKNGANGATYQFEGGRYVIDKDLPQFKLAIDALVKDILGKVDGKADYALMVRGRADATPWKGRFNSAHVFNKLSYLPSTKDEKYLGEATEVKLDGKKLGNQDLPNLRAAFLSELVGKSYPAKTPVILQGVVTPQADPRNRDAVLILYVAW